MKIAQSLLEIRTAGQSLTDISQTVNRAVRDSEVDQGLCTVFVQHTSASLVIQENADPAVQRDLLRWIADLAPEDRPWEHDDEGDDDMPAHAKAAVTKTSESIPIQGGALALGTWQGLYLWEHRARPHTRRLVVHISGI